MIPHFPDCNSGFKTSLQMAAPKSQKSKKLTPMIAQYQAIRRSLPDDVVLFFRLGDFYEMFFEDAKRAAGVLNIALTKRHDVPMCGFPYHSAEGYIAKLVRANTRVAIAEQTTTPVAGQLVEREVTQTQKEEPERLRTIALALRTDDGTSVRVRNSRSYMHTSSPWRLVGQFPGARSSCSSPAASSFVGTSLTMAMTA